MREAGAPSTGGEVVGCPVRRVPGAAGKSWSHRLRSRATPRGRKAKAAPQEGYPVSAARESIKAGARKPRPGSEKNCSRKNTKSKIIDTTAADSLIVGNMPYLRWRASPARNVSNGRAGTP